MTGILYEDADICICHKPSGVPVQSSKGLKRDLLGMYLEYRKLKGEEVFAHVFTRLDEPVSGLCLMGKSKRSLKAFENLPYTKVYEALVTGEGLPKTGHLTGYIRHDKKNNYSYVTDEPSEGAKKSELTYEVVAAGEVDSVPVTKIRVKLITGRHHQIRAMFAHIKHPLYADRKYGVAIPGKNVALCAKEIHFMHPFLKKNIDIETEWKEYEKVC